LGFVLAAACIVPLAARRTGFGRAGGYGDANVPSPKAYIAQLAPLAIAQLGTNVLMQIDITILGRYLSDGAAHAVRGAGHLLSPEREADEWVAVYRACQLFAFLPYQLLFSVTQVLFPMLARAHSERDEAAVTRYVARGSRIAAIACGLMISVIVAAPGPLLSFAYGPLVAERGAGALHFLGLGQGAFAMLGIATTVLASIGRERTAAIITATACACVAGVCFVTLPGTDFGASQIAAAASATSCALGVALAAAAVITFRVTRAFVPIKTALRVLLAVAAAFAMFGYLPGHVGRLSTIALAGAVGVGYLLLLAVTGELGREDIASLRALIRR
jgi:stage V sporulation protein B